MTQKRKTDDPGPKRGVYFISGGWSFSIDPRTAHALVRGLTAIATVVVNGMIFIAICGLVLLAFSYADTVFGLLHEVPHGRGDISGQ